MITEVITVQNFLADLFLKQDFLDETKKNGGTVCFRDLAKLNLPMVVRF
jgi:hypothetical protein